MFFSILPKNERKISAPEGLAKNLSFQVHFLGEFLLRLKCSRWSRIMATSVSYGKRALVGCPIFLTLRRPCFNNNKPMWFSPKKCYTLHQRRLRTALYLSLGLNPIQFRASISTVTITIVFSDFIYGKKTLSETFALFDFLLQNVKFAYLLR